MIVEADLAYAAGIMDGEGSICIRRYEYKNSGHTIPSFTLYAEIRMTNSEAVSFIRSKFGGHLTNKGKTRTGKVIFDWKIYSNKAADFLNRIYPYMKCKKRQAMVADAFSRLPKAYTNKQEITAKRETMRSLISRFNRSSHGIET